MTSEGILIRKEDGPRLNRKKKKKFVVKELESSKI